MRQSLDPDLIAQSISSQIGILFESRIDFDKDGHEFIELVPSGIHRNDGFLVRLTLGWRNIAVEFEPGAFASELIANMGRADSDKAKTYSIIVSRIISEGASFKMSVNDNVLDPSKFDEWPKNWKQLSLSILKSPLAVNTEDKEENTKQAIKWGALFLSAVIALAPVEYEEPSANQEGLPEGACIKIEVNKYERSPQNRSACIAIHGTKCKACGFDFEKTYGSLGTGFIHVHHIIPVSKMGAGYKVNPATDLIPLCPNCHSMVHRNKNLMSLDDLKKIIKESA